MLRELRRGEDILELHGAEARRWRSGGNRRLIDSSRHVVGVGSVSGGNADLGPLV